MICANRVEILKSKFDVEMLQKKMVLIVKLQVQQVDINKKLHGNDVSHNEIIAQLIRDLGYGNATDTKPSKPRLSIVKNDSRDND